jgi:hypothetical protein
MLPKFSYRILNLIKINGLGSNTRSQTDEHDLHRKRCFYFVRKILIIRVIIFGNIPAMTTFNKNMRDPNLELRITSEKRTVLSSQHGTRINILCFWYGLLNDVHNISN